MGLGAVLTLFGTAIFSSTLVKPLASVAGWPMERLRGLTGRLARENALRKPGRTAVDRRRADDRAGARLVRHGVRRRDLRLHRRRARHARPGRRDRPEQGRLLADPGQRGRRHRAASSGVDKVTTLGYSTAKVERRGGRRQPHRRHRPRDLRGPARGSTSPRARRTTLNGMQNDEALLDRALRRLGEDRRRRPPRGADAHGQARHLRDGRRGQGQRRLPRLVRHHQRGAQDATSATGRPE